MSNGTPAVRPELRFEPVPPAPAPVLDLRFRSDASDHDGRRSDDAASAATAALPDKTVADAYARLGLSPGATVGELRQAYRGERAKLVAALHTVHRRRRTLKTAYAVARLDVLGDAGTRHRRTPAAVLQPPQ